MNNNKQNINNIRGLIFPIYLYNFANLIILSDPKMAPRISTTKKIALLNFIKDRKAVLFGKFSNDLENQQKTTAWKEVLVKAKSLEVVSNDRNVSFVRDKVYGVWKSRTLEKRDNKNKTGTGGGKSNVLNDVDHIILDIVGRDTVVIDGLPVGESGAPLATSTANADAELEDQNDRFHAVQDENIYEERSEVPHKRQHRSKAKISADEQELKRKRLQNSLIEITIYKTRLESFKFEKELDLPLSDYTKVLFESNE